MLRSLKEMIGFSLTARDGKLGEVADFYINNQDWSICHIVAGIGIWILKRYLLVPPRYALPVNWLEQKIPLILKREETKEFPDAMTDPPVSKQKVEGKHPPNWVQFWSNIHLPGTPRLAHFWSKTSPTDEAMYDPQLRSSNALCNYTLQGVEGSLGSVADLLADDEIWQVQYFMIDAFHQFPHREFLVDTKWVQEIEMEANTIGTDLKKDQIRNEPEFDPFLLVEMGDKAYLYED